MPCLDIPGMLRKLADEIEEGEEETTRVTVITSTGDVRNFGSKQEDCALYSIFDCQLAIQKILSPVIFD
jgi:hypothetical protein